MHLYSCAGSRGLRCTWTICELGVEDAVALTILPFPPRAFAKQFFAVNPLGTVPALEVDGHVMTESSAICQYLATRFSPEVLAVGADEVDYPAYLDFLHHADATLTFPQTVALRFSIFEKDRGLQAAGDAYGEWFGKRLAKIDARLEDRDYLCAGRFTVADVAIAYALHLSKFSKLDHLLTPRLAEWLAAMTARPAFVRAIAWEKVAADAAGAAVIG